MATDQITADQLTTLKEKVGKLSDDKAAEDAATEASSAAHDALQVAQADVVSKDAAETAAHQIVSDDVADLVNFIEGLSTPATPATAKK